MNNWRIVLGASLLVVCWSAVAGQDFVPYLGVDVKRNTMPFKEDGGNKQIQSHYPQGNFFMGIKLYERLALEVGYESTVRKSREALTPAGEDFFGIVSVGDGLASETKTKAAGPHINIVGFYPLLEENRISLFGSLGLVKLSFKSRLDVSAPPDPEVFIQPSFVKKKVLPRVTLGVEHLITCHLGIRAMMTWEKTSAFKTIYDMGEGFYMRPKNSTSLGAGVFYRF